MEETQKPIENKELIVKKRIEKSIQDNFTKNWNNQSNIHAFAYARISTDKQAVENQIEDIARYCEECQIFIPIKNIFYDWAVSGTISWKDRNIKNIINNIEVNPKENNIIVVVEVSRIARNSLESIELASIMMRNNTTLHDIKNEMVFTKDEMLENDTLLMKFFLLSLFSQIEKNTTKRRVKASLQNEKNKRHNKLDDYKDDLLKYANEGLNANQITDKLKEKGLNINKSQVYTYYKKNF